MSRGDDATDGPTAGPRSQRSDARRNRRAILRAAREHFEREGLDASVHGIAHSAGVGVGTVYRHFPSKQAMLGELLAQLLDEAAARVRRLDDTVATPFVRFSQALEIGATDVASHPLTQLVSAPKTEDGAWIHAAPSRAAFDAAFAPLIAAAQADGSLRPEFRVEDVAPLMAAYCVVVEAGAPDRWRLFLDVTVRGLRAL